MSSSADQPGILTRALRRIGCGSGRLASLLPPEGALIVSHFRSTNHAEFWRRLALDFPVERVVTNEKGQVRDLRVPSLRADAFQDLAA